MTRRRIFRVGGGLFLAATLLIGFSLTRYVLAHPNDPLQQNVASWARENRLGAVVDKLESWLHSEPPAVAPADSLAIDPDIFVDDTIEPESPSTTITTATATNKTPATTIKKSTNTSSPVSGSVPLRVRPTVATASCPTNKLSSTTSSTSTSTSTSTVPVEESTTTSTTSTTTSTIPSRPENLLPQFLPSLEGEGKWKSTVKVRGVPLVYATSIRPLWCYGSVVATVATYDPTRVHTALFNGTEMPGGSKWVNGKRISKRAVPSLLASFNGGFRFEHRPGGYFAEGKTVRPLRKGFATFAISNTGQSTVGVWGDDIRSDGTWKSLRQNLPPIVKNGKSVYANYPGVDWGLDYDNKVYNFRSAVCRRTDGLMMFIAVGKVNIQMLADTLIVLGCSTAMELDINGTWPYFAVYNGFGKSARKGFIIDKRMGDPNRHLNSSTKDFFALFDPETLPAGAVK